MNIFNTVEKRSSFVQFVALLVKMMAYSFTSSHSMQNLLAMLCLDAVLFSLRPTVSDFFPGDKQDSSWRTTGTAELKKEHFGSLNSLRSNRTCFSSHELYGLNSGLLVSGRRFQILWLFLGQLFLLLRQSQQGKRDSQFVAMLDCSRNRVAEPRRVFFFFSYFPLLCS